MSEPTQLSLFDSNGNPLPQNEQEAPQESTQDANDFIRYIVVGYRRDGTLDIGIPEGMTISIPDLWAFANIVNVRATNIFNLSADNLFGPLLDRLERIEQRLDTIVNHSE